MSKVGNYGLIMLTGGTWILIQRRIRSHDGGWDVENIPYGYMPKYETFSKLYYNNWGVEKD